MGPRGGKTNFSAGLPYGSLGVPPGGFLGAWLAGRITGKSAAADQRLTLARTAIMLMTIVPLLLWFAGLVATPGRPNDPIAVSTAFAFFVISPGAIIAALLLSSCSIAAVFLLAALVWIGDLWLIGFGVGTQVVVAEDVCVADGHV